MYKKIFLSFIIIIFFNSVYSQSNISFKVVTLGSNPFENRNSAIYTNKLSDDGLFTFEPGLQIALELFGNVYTSAKVAQTVHLDQAGQFAGFTQIMLRRKLFQYYKHSMTIGIGPSLFFRKDWHELDNYKDESIYKQSNDFQTKVCWLSGEIEYNYYLSKKVDFGLTINHLHPESIGLMIGLKYWFMRKSSKCNTCPSFRH